MQTVLVIAATIAVLIGIMHSFLGERLIFSHLREGTVVPSLGARPLRAPHVRILWATWHLASVFGWAFAALLFQLATSSETPLRHLVLEMIVAANAGGSLLVFVGTRGRHPGWAALGAVAVLVWIAT